MGFLEDYLALLYLTFIFKSPIVFGWLLCIASSPLEEEARHKFQVRSQTFELKTSSKSQDALVFCDCIVREHIWNILEQQLLPANMGLQNLGFMLGLLY